MRRCHPSHDPRTSIEEKNTGTNHNRSRRPGGIRIGPRHSNAKHHDDGAVSARRWSCDAASRRSVARIDSRRCPRDQDTARDECCNWNSVEHAHGFTCGSPVTQSVRCDAPAQATARIQLGWRWTTRSVWQPTPCPAPALYAPDRWSHGRIQRSPCWSSGLHSWRAPVAPRRECRVAAPAERAERSIAQVRVPGRRHQT